MADDVSGTEAGDEICEIEVKVVNRQGLHARPAHQVVILANEFPCNIVIAKGDHEVDAKSIMSLMMLAAEKGVTLRIRAIGKQANEATMALAGLFESGFNED